MPPLSCLRLRASRQRARAHKTGTAATPAGTGTSPVVRPVPILLHPPAGWHTLGSPRKDRPETPMDKLELLFAKQKELNEHICRKRGLGEDLWDRFLARDAGPELQRDWTLNYARAMIHEAVELEASCAWKWWSDDELIDLQNARVEVIDLWHFLLSASMVVGLSAADVVELYAQKHAVNKQRQDQGYSQASKNEDDNRTVGL